jgi:hypothetical protein
MQRGPPTRQRTAGQRTQGTLSAPHSPLRPMLHIADYQPLTGAACGGGTAQRPPAECSAKLWRELARRSYVPIAGLDVAEEVVESLEPLLPVRSVLSDPFRGVSQRSGGEAARAPLRLPATLDQPGALEDAQVLADRRLAEVERGGQLGHRCLSLRQADKDRSPRRIGEGSEGEAQLVGRPIHCL